MQNSSYVKILNNVLIKYKYLVYIMVWTSDRRNNLNYYLNEESQILEINNLLELLKIIYILYFKLIILINK